MKKILKEKINFDYLIQKVKVHLFLYPLIKYSNNYVKKEIRDILYLVENFLNNLIKKHFLYCFFYQKIIFNT